MPRPDRPVYCGNFDYAAEEFEVRELCEEYGKIERIDMKQGFAFVYFRHEDEAERCIRKLNNVEWGRKRRPLLMQWAKQKESDRAKRVDPTTTLFIVNFHPERTTTRDLERVYDAFGPLKRVQIKRNFAFVEFAHLDDAIVALKKTNAAIHYGRTWTVEFCQNQAAAGAAGGALVGRGRGSYSRSPPPRRRARSLSRSRSPPPRRRGSPSISPPRRRRGSPSISPVPRRRRSASRSASPPPKRRPASRSPSRSASPPPKRRAASRSVSRSASPPPKKRAASRSASPPPKKRAASRSVSRSASPLPKRGRSGSRSASR